MTSIVAMKSNMRRLKRRLTASLEWLNNNIDCFGPLQAGELSEAGIKSLCEFAIAYAGLEGCRSRASPLANFSPLQKSFKLPGCKHRLARVITQPRRAASTDTSTRRMGNGTNNGT
jgi:hypothetical protein